MGILTVTQLNRYVAFKLKEDVRLNGILVRGEISGFTRNLRSGHCYFTLKDAESSVKAVLFRNQASRIRIPLQDGMRVIAAASATLYERDGVFQLYVTDLQADGVGQQQAALEQLKKKLTAMGVFDAEKKRPIPSFPNRIGVVTSASGAAIRDIEQVIGRRYPVAELLLFPAQVQGEAAPEHICHAISCAEAADCDVLIVGRGGGSAEDLAAFQTESVVMAVHRCTVPVISAVGHETDQTLTDYAADLRAPTPSAAAELAVPSALELLEQIRNHQQQLQTALGIILQKKQIQLKTQQKILSHYAPKKRYASLQKEWNITVCRLQNAMQGYLQKKQLQLQVQVQALSANSPENQFGTAEKMLHLAEKQLQMAMQKHLERKKWQLHLQQTKLESSNPLRILASGYAVVQHKGRVVCRPEDVKPGDLLTIRLGGGSIQAQVVEQEEAENDL